MSAIECHFCFCSPASFFLALLVIILHSSPVACWKSSDLLAHLLMSYLFAFFHTVYRALQAGLLKWFVISSSSVPCFLELSTMTCPSWVTLRGMVHSFTELHKPLHHDKSVIHEGIRHIHISI